MLDIKEKIEEITGKIKNDPKMMDEFKKDPVKTIEKLTGIDLPDDITEKVAAGVKSKLGGDDKGGIGGKIKDLMGKC